MNRKTLLQIISVILFLILGSLTGFLIGTFLGGNYFYNFEFWGFKGYEAVGWLGIILGGALGAAVGIFLGLLATNKKQRK